MTSVGGLLALDGNTWAANYARHAYADSPAVITSAGPWSFRDLTSRAGAWADWLDGLNLEPGAPLPVMVGSAPETYALWLAGVCIGHPLMPLGVRMTPTEIAACVRTTDVAVLAVEAEYRGVAERVAALTGQRVVVLPAQPAGDRRLDFEVADDAVMMVLHTSGTTGVPKRVFFGQARMAARLRVYAELLKLQPSSVYSSSQQFHHLAGIGLLAVALGAGAAVVPPTPKFSTEGWRQLSSHGVTHATIVPTMMEMLLDSGDLAFPSLQLITYGASPVRPVTARRMLAEHPEIGLLQGYSQTEGGPMTALTPEDHAYAAEHAPELLGSVGRPVKGIEIVIDSPDADGIGEVWARGAHLTQPGPDGWLHTGDLGVVDAAGYLFLSGRKGDMIIRGGENVYPEEVEAALMRHPAVREAAVVGRADDRYGESVVAWIVAQDADAPPDTEELRRFVRQNLAGFKVPTSWEFVSALPRGSLGKMLRRELRGEPG
jgi:acyl-CoA synthetase (AMP-forming)/AMP-acid ligase II